MKKERKNTMKYNSKVKKCGATFSMRGETGYCMDIDVEEGVEEVRIPDDVYNFSISNHTKKRFEYPATMLENLFALILHADSIQYVISDVMHHVMETTSYKRALSVGYFGKSDYAFSYSKEGAIRNGEILYIKTPSRAYVIPIDITYTNGMKVIK